MIRVRFGSLIINTTLVIKCNKNYLRCIFGGGSFQGILAISCVSRLCDPIRLRSISFAIFVVSTTGQGAGTMMNHGESGRPGLQVIHR